MTITPLDDRVIVRLDKSEKIQNKIIIPQTVEPKHIVGEVMSIGPKVLEVKIGDKILLNKFVKRGLNFPADETVASIRESEILGVVED
jgi:co-chaperonin GroES (HSP10)